MKVINFFVSTILSALCTLIYFSYQNYLDSEKVLRNLHEVEQVIHDSTLKSIIGLEVLSSHLSLNKKRLHVENFDLVANRILKIDSDILTLGIAPNGVVSEQVYPKNDYNNLVINHDVSNDKSRMIGYEITKKNKYIYLGPLLLKQTNRPGYIVRRSIFNNDEYVGFVFIAYEKEKLFFFKKEIFDFDFKLFGFNPDSNKNEVIYQNGIINNDIYSHKIKVDNVIFTIILNNKSNVLNSLIVFLCLFFVFFSSFYYVRKYFKVFQKQKKLVLVDTLTGCYNRRAINNYIPNKIISLAVVDIDHFKVINDAYGHLCGDIVLQQFSSTLLKSFRANDMVVRFGGEEFVVIMEDTSLKFAYDSCERFRKSISLLLFGHNSDIKITCSIGIVSEESNNIDDIIHKADIALYKAKQNGRNRIEIYD